jgi:hypothetical protein
MEDLQKTLLKKYIAESNVETAGTAEHITTLDHRVTDLSTEVGDIKGSVGRMETMLKTMVEKFASNKA